MARLGRPTRLRWRDAQAVAAADTMDQATPSAAAVTYPNVK